MIDIDVIRKNPTVVKKDLEKRGLAKKVVDEVKKKDDQWRKGKKEVDELRRQRNQVSLKINEAKKVGKSAAALLKKAKAVAQKIEKKEHALGDLRKEIDDGLMRIPNLLDESVPVGKDENDNVEVRKWGRTAKAGDLKNHVELCEQLGIADFDRAAKISGQGFYFLKNDLVLLEQALIRFALDIMKGKGFTLTSVPMMMRRKPYEGVTDFDAFEEVMYKVEEQDEYMIATSEHPLTAQFMDEILDELPIKLAGVSSCFRKEAGGHGVDEKGIFRVHQFNKVEQVVVCAAEDSEKWHEEMLKTAEEIFKALGLPYRVVLLCSADTGIAMSKTYDIELWMPRTQKYREAVSCSNAKDYQARRLKVRHRADGMKFVHTLNSTAIATTRTMVAILENFQQKDGSVKIPKVLWPYGVKVIGKK